MKSTTLYLALIVVTVSCKRPAQKENIIYSKTKDTDIVSSPYSNPALIYGTSFGTFFQSLYKNNNTQLMLAFTSNKSKQLYGIDAINSFYKNRFRFDFNLGKLSNVVRIQDTVKLTYANSSIYGTRRKVVVNCIIENDSTKFLLSNLNSCPF